MFARAHDHNNLREDCPFTSFEKGKRRESMDDTKDVHTSFENEGTTYFCRTRDPDCNHLKRSPAVQCGYYTSVEDGNCTFDCLSLIWNKLVKYEPMDAQKMRHFIFEYIDSNWYNVSSINDMKWSDAITLQHNSCITDEERMLYEVWPEDEMLRLIAWRRERQTMYGGPTELNAFVEFLTAKGVKICVRLWRSYDRKLVLSSSIPPINTEEGTEYIVADMVHSGQMDSSNAHMRLLKTSSFATPNKNKRVKQN